MFRFALAALIVPAGLASAQGYFSDFEADDGGLVGTGDWQWGMPSGFSGAPFGGAEPIGGHSGGNAWGTIIGGAHSPSTISDLTLSIDLTGAQTLSFWEFSESGGNAFDMAEVLVGGDQVYLSDGNSGLDWRLVTIDLTAVGPMAGDDIVFRFTTSAVVERVGWYIDDVRVAVPAPASAALLGLGGIATVRRRR